ncbi:MAG: hypothetical protein Q9187_000187 [Circinaria calcarea]
MADVSDGECVEVGVEDLFATATGVEDEEGEEGGEEVKVPELVGDDNGLVGWRTGGRGRGSRWQLGGDKVGGVEEGGEDTGDAVRQGTVSAEWDTFRRKDEGRTGDVTERWAQRSGKRNAGMGAGGMP